jgi:uncharacterized membrane protein
MRGLAVLIMIAWHTLDSWTAAADRSGVAFAWITVIGGCAAPLFLFLAGVSVPLAGASRGTRRQASWRLQKRGWEVFVLAHLFRLQSFLLNPTASWSSLLKPDILNILGLGIVLTAYCWGRATSRAKTMGWLVLPAAAIVWLAPASREWVWPELLRAWAPRLEAYIRPVSGMGVFSVFPWLAFVFVGAIVGSAMADSASKGESGTFQWRLAAAGAVVVLAGMAGSHLPAITASSFWTTSLSFFLIRTGAMTLALSAAWVWLRRPTGARWSPMIVFGRSSLFVYWVHVELAYGFFTRPLQGVLALPLALAAFAVFTAAILRLTMWWSTFSLDVLTSNLALQPSD